MRVDLNSLYYKLNTDHQSLYFLRVRLISHNDQTADLVTEEGSQQSAPLNEDCRTAWDDYTNHSNHD
jgi:hypothetical protein